MAIIVNIVLLMIEMIFYFKCCRIILMVVGLYVKVEQGCGSALAFDIRKYFREAIPT